MQKDLIGKIQQTCRQLLQQVQGYTNWSKVSDKPCPSFKADLQDRFITRTEAIYDLPFQPVYKFYSHPLALKKLGNQVDIAQIINDEQDQKVIYLKMKPLGFTSARQMVAAHTIFNKGNKAYIGLRSLDFPCKLADSNAVRAVVNVGGFILQKLDERRTMVTFLMDADYKIWMPWFFKNLVAERRAEIIKEAQQQIASSLN